jgi:hypothetical protein
MEAAIEDSGADLKQANFPREWMGEIRISCRGRHSDLDHVGALRPGCNSRWPKRPPKDKKGRYSGSHS